ncbi:MAG TPA: hypothetical protein VIV15_10510 [Anaerolineales bacterium]
MHPDRPRAHRFSLLAGSVALFAALLIAGWASARRPKPVELVPTITGKSEYCLTCHSDLSEISGSHSLKTVGCVLCHGGERLALDADLAHSTMRGGANPSALSVVEASCGGDNCHSGTANDNRDHIHRVMTSLQATYAGAIASIRYTFGTQPDLNAYQGISQITDEKTLTGITSLTRFEPSNEENPSVQKFGQNCLTCHLDASPREGEAFDRQAGCAACHLTGKHTFSTAIPYAKCNACHNRGNYDLRTMTFVERSDHPTNRLQDYYQPIAEFTKCEYTLDCVDCHSRGEVMGDGDLHPNKKDSQYIQCSTCHGTPNQLPLTRTLTDPNDISFRLDRLNPIMDLKLKDTILVTEKDEPLWNIRVLGDGTYEMIGKATGERFIFRPVQGSGCTQNNEDQSSAYCHKCHAAKR